MTSKAWTVLDTNNTPKDGLFRHSCCLDEENSRIFVFGGEDDNNMFVKKAFCLDLLTMTWSDLSMRLNVPLQIDSHTCIHYKGSFYIYGGNDSTTDFDIVVVYRIKVSPYGIEVETVFEDSVLTNQELPDPRREHTSELIITEEFGAEMVVYGGRSRMTPKKVLGDCWAFSLNSYEWRLVKSELPARCCHCSTYDYDKKRILLFGGRNEKHLYCNETFEITIPNFEFNTLSCKVAQDSNEEGSSSLMVGKRESSSASYFNGSMYITGGWCFGQSKNDIWLLDLEDNRLEWMVYEGKVGKEKRRGHTSFIFKEKMYILGGKTESNSSDLISVKLMK